MMFKQSPYKILFICLLTFSLSLFAEDKQRIIVLTDIENEPDDAMSLVRFLCYANQWDLEGIVATTSIQQQHQVATWRINEILEAYGKVRDNLEKHEKGYPEKKALLSVVREGRTDYGMNAVGEGMDSPGSELIINVVDKKDERPVWVLVWGGPNCLAQALWKVKNTRTQKELEHFVSKIRVYTISDHDNSGPWIRKTFPGLFYVVSPGFHRYGGYHYATWSGISGDFFHARCPGGDFSLVNNEWLDKHIQNKGPLGAQYPDIEYLMEGDSPSFMFLINNGLGHPDHPDWGSWGGRYELYQPRFEKWFLKAETRPIWTNVCDEVLGSDDRWHTSNHATIWRWRAHFQNDFAARMDGTIKNYDESNHPPQPNLAHEAYMTVKAGERVNLSAEGTTDPDGDALTYEWFLYGEPGTAVLATARTGAPLDIKNSDAKEAFQSVLDHAGCSFPTRDKVDADIIDDVINGTAKYGNKGIIDSPGDVGGWPELKSTKAPKDSDHDGMPDMWEKQNELDPNNADDRNIIASDGYTMLEKYLNGFST